MCKVARDAVCRPEFCSSKSRRRQLTWERLGLVCSSLSVSTSKYFFFVSIAQPCLKCRGQREIVVIAENAYLATATAWQYLACILRLSRKYLHFLAFCSLKLSSSFSLILNCDCSVQRGFDIWDMEGAGRSPILAVEQMILCDFHSGAVRQTETSSISSDWPGTDSSERFCEFMSCLICYDICF